MHDSKDAEGLGGMFGGLLFLLLAIGRLLLIVLIGGTWGTEPRLANLSVFVRGILLFGCLGGLGGVLLPRMIDAPVFFFDSLLPQYRFLCGAVVGGVIGMMIAGFLLAIATSGE